TSGGGRVFAFSAALPPVHAGAVESNESKTPHAKRGVPGPDNICVPSISTNSPVLTAGTHVFSTVALLPEGPGCRVPRGERGPSRRAAGPAGGRGARRAADHRPRRRSDPGVRGRAGGGGAARRGGDHPREIT